MEQDDASTGGTHGTAGAGADSGESRAAAAPGESVATREPAQTVDQPSGLVFRGVGKRFARRGPAALESVDLEVPAGTMLSVVGPSGCGKTTLLRLAAGLERPSTGEVLLDGRPVRLGESAVVFQDVPLYPQRTVAQNVAFPLELRAAGRIGVAERRRRTAEALELMRIGELGRRRPHELSGGQRQRVGIARALVRGVGVYLFDEPLSHLDEALARRIREDLRQVQQERRLTCVYVTHNTEEAYALGDRIAVFDSGRVQQIGSPRRLWDAPATAFVADFLGGMPLNRIPERDGGFLAFRPEDALVTPWGSADPGRTPWDARRHGIRLRARVLGRQHLGDRVRLALEGEAGPVAALVPAEAADAVADGEQVLVRTAPGRAHRFDAEGCRAEA